MNKDQVLSAAATLYRARREQVPLSALPEDLRPAGPDDAYAIQDALVALDGAKVVGFKIGATSEKAQSFLQVSGPFSGQVMASGLHDSPLALPAPDGLFRLIEPEFALRLGRALPPRDASYALDDVAAAVKAVHPSVEIVTSAYGDAWTGAGAEHLIADNGVHNALVLGPGTEDWRDLDLAAHPVRLHLNGEVVSDGVGANALGGPLTALLWLANHQRTRGRGLAAGQVVTTGVVTAFRYAEAGDHFVADYGDLGQVEVRFDA